MRLGFHGRTARQSRQRSDPSGNQRRDETTRLRATSKPQPSSRSRKTYVTTTRSTLPRPPKASYGEKRSHRSIRQRDFDTHAHQHRSSATKIPHATRGAGVRLSGNAASSGGGEVQLYARHGVMTTEFFGKTCFPRGTGMLAVKRCWDDEDPRGGCEKKKKKRR